VLPVVVEREGITPAAIAAGIAVVVIAVLVVRSLCAVANEALMLQNGPKFELKKELNKLII
jgi:hypothetical protein